MQIRLIDIIDNTTNSSLFDGGDIDDVEKLSKSRFLFVLTFFLLSCSEHPRSSNDSCRLPSPPKSAGVNSNHGMFFYIFPRNIDPKFTGCQTLWDEKGNKHWIAHYENGIPYQLTISPSSNDKETCLYKDETLFFGDKESCLEYSGLVNGFPIIPKAHEPDIPKNRDIRQ